MNLSSAPEIASRTGVVQSQTAATKPTVERDSDTLLLGAFSEENETSGNATATPPEKRIPRRRETRRRRQAQVDQARLDNGREVEARKATATEESRSTRGPQRRGASWTPEKGLRTAQQLFHQQALLNQASIRFEQQRGPTHDAKTPFGQQQAMLDSLISMTEMLYHQHTGDKAGEIFTRPATRQLLTALKGLKNNAVGVGEQPETQPQPVRRSKREFQAQLERVERVHRAIEPVNLPEDYEPLDLVA